MIVSPDGQNLDIQLKEKNSSLAQGKVLAELNRLRQSGWRVVQMSGSAMTGGTIVDLYLLENTPQP
ncbi:hypothetical protein [Hymenobacter cheonanensis]|uniref:hypothetical protein n=1 Tax=Hymenobacter sp. CA2-7 TaxID=3063993 RepID=UPI00271412A9|nr:hypothetical protein [Hymenobacter sp. CA2-7]MDO7885178.1 hypothetical protein [Hymenobacter sp. CA2-7]